jgi:UPF0042 nucleotide-binding protein
VAVVLDARGITAADVPGLVKAIRDLGVPHRLIYLDAGDEALVRRFSETRRVHPLDEGEGLRHAIAAERELLGELREIADVIDTSDMRVDELVRRIHEVASRDGGSPGGSQALPVTLLSFGYKYGVPTEADWILDSRFLENPFYISELRDLTGEDEKVRAFVLSSPLTAPFLDGIADVLQPLLGGYREWGKPGLMVAVGCTGGRHRSVVLAEELARRLDRAGASVSIRHRDLGR